MSDGEVACSGVYVRETAKAYLIRVTDGRDNDPRWIPKSVVTDITDGALKEGDEVDFFVKPWFAEKEDL